MDELQGLQHQLEEARDEAELNLLQLQQVQEELEFYFLRCQQLEDKLSLAEEAQTGPTKPSGNAENSQLDRLVQERDQAHENSETAHRLASDLRQQLEQERQLLQTAQSMLVGQARYLEDVSSREEKAAVAIERLQILESEILYYIQNSRPLQSLNPDKIRRLIEISKTPARAINHP